MKGRAVLWGARRGDWPIGGAYDRRRQELFGDLTRAIVAMGRAAIGDGITAAEALRAMQTFARIAARTKNAQGDGER